MEVVGFVAVCRDLYDVDYPARLCRGCEIATQTYVVRLELESANDYFLAWRDCALSALSAVLDDQNPHCASERSSAVFELMEIVLVLHDFVSAMLSLSSWAGSGTGSEI